MKTSELVRAKIANGISGLLVILTVILFIQAGAVHGQESTEPDNSNNAWQQDAGNRKHPWQGKKDRELSFDEDSGKGNGHKKGKPGKRVGHSDDMPGKRLGHRKNQSDQTDASQGEGNKSRRRRFDNDNNPPGRRGGEGTNWENKPGPRGGPGMSPDKFGRRRFGNGNNPQGRQRGEGTNLENKPGRRGGPGMSPDRSKFRKGNSNSGDESSTGRRKRIARGHHFKPDRSESAENSSADFGRGERKGSNGLHLGNRKNNAGKGIKNYTGNNPGRGRGRSK